MRKGLILSLVCLLSFANLFAKNNRDSVMFTEDTLGIHPWKKTAPLPPADRVAHWSLSFEAGFSLIDADFHQPNITIVPVTRIRPSGGILLEYDFTPVLGIAASYYYGNYGVRHKVGDESPYLLYGHMHSMEALLTVDLVDAWFQKRQSTVFSAYLLAGGGIGFYNSDYTPSAGVCDKPRTDGKYAMAGLASLGVLLEFNLSRATALGVRGMYHIHNTDLLDTKLKGVTNDYMEYLSLTFRWKMGATKKNHIRNYSPRGLEQELEKWEPKRDTLVIKDTTVISHVDTVYNYVTTPGAGTTFVPVIAGGGGAGVAGQGAPRKEIACYYVYFDNDKDILDNDALQKIQEVSRYLIEDPSLCVEVKGFCDNTASVKHNESLSKRRAKRVMNEFFNVYKIDESRVLDLGLGMIRNTKSSYRPNRRVEMRIVSYGELENVRQQKDSLELQYNTDPKVWEKLVRESGGHVDIKKQLKQAANEVEKAVTPKAAEKTAEKPATNKVNNSEDLSKLVDELIADIEETEAPAKAEPLAKVKVDKSTTLVRLARKYYNNGDFWPIIYEANRSVVSNPDRLRIGSILTVPALTEAQKQMSTQSLQDLAKRYLK